METFKTLADATKAKGYSGKSAKVGKGTFTPLKAKGKGGIGKYYRKGHNSAHAS